MTSMFTFDVLDACGRQMPVELVRLDDAPDSYLLVGPDDVHQRDYTDELRHATTLAPLPLEDVLTLAADLGCSGTPQQVA